MQMAENVLSNIYYKESNPGSYGGARKLYKQARNIDGSITFKTVKEWLQSQLVYTLHKDARRKFKRNPIIVERINENLQSDLVDLKDLASSNDGNRYILTVIDVFSKKAWAIPILNKTAQNVCNVLESILKHNPPFKIQTDKGKEFENLIFRKL